MKSLVMAATGGCIILVLALCTNVNPKQSHTEVTARPTVTDLVKRGELLVTIGGCNDCHSPKIVTENGLEIDPKRMLSGHPAEVPLPALTEKKMVAPGQWVLFAPDLTAAVGPWGTSFAANLTPDDTGIGNWDFEQFKKAIREGKSKGMDGTRPLLPPMPWFNFAKMSDDDLLAVFTYLKSLPPVKNAVPNPQPPVS